MNRCSLLYPWWQILGWSWNFLTIFDAIKHNNFVLTVYDIPQDRKLFTFSSPDRIFLKNIPRPDNYFLFAMFQLWDLIGNNSSILALRVSYFIKVVLSNRFKTACYSFNHIIYKIIFCYNSGKNNEITSKKKKISTETYKW